MSNLINLLFDLLFLVALMASGYYAKRIDIQSELKEYWFFLKWEPNIRKYLFGHSIMVLIFYVALGSTGIVNTDIKLNNSVEQQKTTEDQSKTQPTPNNSSQNNLDKKSTDQVSTTDFTSIGEMIFKKALLALVLGFSLIGMASQTFISSATQGGKSFSFSAILDPYYDYVVKNIENIVPGNKNLWIESVDEKMNNTAPRDVYLSFFNYLRHHNLFRSEQGKSRLIYILKELKNEENTKGMLHKALEELDIHMVIRALSKYKIDRIKY